MYLKVYAVLLFLSAAAWGAPSVDNDAVLRFGQELEQLLDISKAPCQDFYGYVCARSNNVNQTQRRQQQQQRFQQLLKSTNANSLLEMEQQLVNFYKSCEQSRGVEALRSSQLYRSSGGWPALEASSSNLTLSWLGLLGYFHEMGAPYFFETKISMQSNKRLVVLQPDETRRHTMRKFEQRVGELLLSFGVEQSRAHVASLEVLSLERNRRDIVKTERVEDQVEFSYANFKRSSFGNASLNRLDWDGYFKKLLNGKTLQPTDTIVVKQLPRLVDYMLLLQNTSMHRLLNWIWIDYLIDIAAADCQQLAETYAGDVYAHLLQRVSADRLQMTQMYASIGKLYKEQLASSIWIDEISEQASQRFLGQVMHLTLNGDERLNAAYKQLQLGRRSFYRNMEKLRRFQQRRQLPSPAAAQQLRQYAQIFEIINGLLFNTQLNLSMPLNYLLVAEPFARTLIAAGSSSRTPGAWRSIDSERQFASYQSCSNATAALSNELLLGNLAQSQAWSSYTQWLSQQTTTMRLNARLSVGRLQLSLQRLYFIASLLVDGCRDQVGGVGAVGAVQQERRRQLQHAMLRNTPEFSVAFSCRHGDALYAQQQRCKLSF